MMIKTAKKAGTTIGGTNQDAMAHLARSVGRAHLIVDSLKGDARHPTVVGKTAFVERIITEFVQYFEIFPLLRLVFAPLSIMWTLTSE